MQNIDDGRINIVGDTNEAFFVAEIVKQGQVNWFAWKLPNVVENLGKRFDFVAVAIKIYVHISTTLCSMQKNCYKN